MLLKVYAVCVPLLSFTYIVCACNPVNPSPNKSTALNFNRLCLILFPPFLLVINHFIYLFIVNVSMLLLGFLPLNANVRSYTQGRIAGDFLSNRKTARAERCPPKTTVAG